MQALDTPNERPLPPMEKVISLWKRNGLKQSSAFIYQGWIQRFIFDCTQREVAPLSHLTEDEVRLFSRRYARRKRINILEAQRAAHRSLFAWYTGLVGLGYQLAKWSQCDSSSLRMTPLMKAYSEYRHIHSNVTDNSINREIIEAEAWLRFLSLRKRKLQAVRLTDIDAYMLKLRRRYAVATVLRSMSCLRQFLRFLESTGRIEHDLASSIQCPLHRHAKLPRALPWQDVRKILRAVDQSTRIGVRNYAILLIMSLYGLGSAEVIRLKLEDVHWRARTITINRPKTGVQIELPLLPAAAQVLSGYLRKGRPPNALTRTFFVRHLMPYIAFTSSAIRFAIRHYAIKAGLHVKILGGHVLRHSFASRQVDLQAPTRVLSSILGHLDPTSTSTYTRVAVERLRGIALRVPR